VWPVCSGNTLNDSDPSASLSRSLQAVASADQTAPGVSIADVATGCGPTLVHPAPRRRSSRAYSDCSSCSLFSTTAAAAESVAMEASRQATAHMD